MRWRRRLPADQIEQVLAVALSARLSKPDAAFEMRIGLEASQVLLGLVEVPVVCLSHLSDAQKRAYVLADNKIALNAGWDAELLATEFGELADLLPEIELNLDVTGFEMGEIDVLLNDFDDLQQANNTDDDVL